MTVMPQAKLALAVLLPVAAVQLLLNALQPVLFGLLWVALAAFLLLYSFGRRDFHELMERYRGQCRSADFEGAYLTTLAELGWATPDDNPGSPAEVHALVQRGFAYEGYQRWFAVLFYFVLLGPAGALAYRLLQLCHPHFEARRAERWLFLVDWVPARLLAATFALAGDFVHSLNALLDALLDTSIETSQILYRVAMAALGRELSGFSGESELPAQSAAQNEALGSLLKRSAACWVVVLSLLVLL